MPKIANEIIEIVKDKISREEILKTISEKFPEYEIEQELSYDFFISGFTDSKFATINVKYIDQDIREKICQCIRQALTDFGFLVMGSTIDEKIYRILLRFDEPNGGSGVPASK